MKQIKGKKASTTTVSAARLIGHILFAFMVFISISYVYSKIFVFTIDSVEAEAFIYSQAILKCISIEEGNRAYLGIVDPQKLDSEALEKCFFLGELEINKNTVSFRGQVFLDNCTEECEPEASFYYSDQAKFYLRKETHESHPPGIPSPLIFVEAKRNVVYDGKDAMLLIEFYFPKPTKNVS
jgi:hypothetical protein